MSAVAIDVPCGCECKDRIRLRRQSLDKCHNVPVRQSVVCPQPHEIFGFAIVKKKVEINMCSTVDGVSYLPDMAVARCEFSANMTGSICGCVVSDQNLLRLPDRRRNGVAYELFLVIRRNAYGDLVPQ